MHDHWQVSRKWFFMEGIKSAVVKLLLNLNMESDINRENCEGS